MTTDLYPAALAELEAHNARVREFQELERELAQQAVVGVLPTPEQRLRYHALYQRVML